MKKSYPESYAIAVRDAGELFLMFSINRDAAGDVYVNFNKRDNKHKPHSSYHASGQLHHKSYGSYNSPIRKYQPPNDKFSGSEPIITTSIRKGDARAWGILCKPKDYTEVMEIEDKIITPKFGYQFLVELVELRVTSWISTYPYAKIIQQKIFKKSVPWIVASLYEMSLTRFKKSKTKKK